MWTSTGEKLMAKILSVGAAFTTVAVVSGSVTDPVNAPKLIVLGITSTATLCILAATGSYTYLTAHRLAVFSTVLFVLAMIFSVFSSKSPLSQNMYGSYGRNNGFLTYLFLAFILLSALSLRDRKSFELIVKTLLFAGVVNIFYCLWVIIFGDFIGWSNPYGNILGTLGNPNFIGSFLGIFFTAYLSFAINKTSSRYVKYSLFVVLPLTAYEIYKSHAIQGRVVGLLGIGILGFLLIRSRYSNLITMAYLVLGFFVGAFSLLGALQIGPLTKYIYKTSVSLRGQYWLAGWNTGERHPLNGVGMDAFGDWYRRSRDIHALELPGVNTVVNAAHNVPMDMFAFGGWPLFSAYLLILGLAAVAAVKVIIRKKDYDPIFAVILTAWSGYQLQSIISINQIGLAIWGWLLSGALIAYQKYDSGQILNNSKIQTRTVSKSKEQSPLFSLAGVLGAIIGLVISLPPMASDAKWRGAQVARSATGIEASMEPNFFNPQNSQKYLSNIQGLEQSNLFELSHKYALEAVAWNPDAFELWKVLYLLKNSTPEEKSTALKNMKRLDPLNPDVTSIS